MRALQQHMIAFGIKDILCIIYIAAVVILGMVALLEFKLAYNIDMLPGIDLPIDEWYAATFH